MMSNLTRDEVKEMGFYELPHFTIGRSLIYDLGRDRHLSISSLGTPNEMVFLDEVDRDNDKEITNLIVIRNYDYDGPLTREILEMLLKALTAKTGHKAMKEQTACPECNGQGYIVEVRPVCCMQYTELGMCCNDPLPEPEQVYCPVCNPYIPPVKDDDLPF